MGDNLYGTGKIFVEDHLDYLPRRKVVFLCSQSDMTSRGFLGMGFPRQPLV